MVTLTSERELGFDTGETVTANKGSRFVIYHGCVAFQILDFGYRIVDFGDVCWSIKFS